MTNILDDIKQLRRKNPKGAGVRETRAMTIDIDMAKAVRDIAEENRVTLNAVVSYAILALIQSGVYTVHLLDKNGKPEIKAKSRGFRPDNTEKRENETHKDVLDRTLRETIPAQWANGSETYSFDYKQYMTVGLSVQHRKFDTTIGCCKNAPRDLRLNTMSNKRILPGEAKKDAAKRSGKEFPLTQKEIRLRFSRAKKLIALSVRPLMPWEYALSAASDIDWIDDKTRLERQEVEDLENVAAGLT